MVWHRVTLLTALHEFTVFTSHGYQMVFSRVFDETVMTPSVYLGGGRSTGRTPPFDVMAPKPWVFRLLLDRFEKGLRA